MSYSGLHNHSMYSLLDGYATPEEYLKRAKEIGLKAFCITLKQGKPTKLLNCPNMEQCPGW